MKGFRAPRGTVDILPQEQPYWRYVLGKAESLGQLYGYRRIDTPIFETAALFVRGVGPGTDIVEKEMYLFQDRSGEALALRPEGTANVCRAYLQHGLASLTQPVRLYYWGPAFRYDRPQAGRQRQFHQLGYEAIGEADPALDAEVIEIAWGLYRELGLGGLTMQLNSIGCHGCRPAYLEALKEYYRERLAQACADCRGRFRQNPLRLLDCKEEGCQPLIGAAPAVTDHLCADCADHSAQLRRYLGALEVPYLINPRLVRGLDYYTRTVFEVQPQGGGAQSTIGAGGRYDGLIEELGGPPTPAVGFATGIERIIAQLKQQGLQVPGPPPLEVYVAYPAPEAREVALGLARELRRAGVSAVIALGGRSLKSQMRQANALGAHYVAILGAEELATDTVLLRRMADGGQRRVLLRDLPYLFQPAPEEGPPEQA